MRYCAASGDTKLKPWTNKVKFQNLRRLAGETASATGMGFLAEC
jgi:hypothetical protein